MVVMKESKKKNIKNALLRIDANIPFSLSIVVSLISSFIVSIIMVFLLKNYVDYSSFSYILFIFISLFITCFMLIETILFIYISLLKYFDK